MARDWEITDDAHRPLTVGSWLQARSSCQRTIGAVFIVGFGMILTIYLMMAAPIAAHTTQLAVQETKLETVNRKIDQVIDLLKAGPCNPGKMVNK
jgi:hypothetical protein